jgi:hypothetical protein
LSLIDLWRLPDGRAVVLTDGGFWNTSSGALSGLGAKQSILAHLPAVAAARNAPLYVPLLGHFIGSRFSGSWDQLVAEIESEIEGLHNQAKAACSACGEVASDQAIHLAGYSRERGRSEVFVIETSTALPSVMREEEKAVAATMVRPAPFKLHAPAGGAFLHALDFGRGTAAHWDLVRENRVRHLSLFDSFAGISACESVPSARWGRADLDLRWVWAMHHP